MRNFYVLALSMLLFGCGIARQHELQARNEELKAQSVAAQQQCNQTYPAGNPKTAVARAKCQTEAFAILRPMMPYPDLMDLLIANRMEVAERVQSGKLTIAQANEILAIKRSEAVAEEQRRWNANRSVAAQEQSATAATIGAFAANAPRTCTAFGNTVNCF
jgi:hypothetical protein